MNEDTKLRARVQSVTAKLSTLARNQGMPYDRMLTLFLLERAACRLLSDDSLADHLIFKGGYINVRVYGSPRYTTDLDLGLVGLTGKVASAKILGAMSTDFDDCVWFKHFETIDLKTQGEYGGTRFAFRTGLGAPPQDIDKCQILDIDLAIGDPVEPPPKRIKTKLVLGEESISWRVYPVETIVSEKLHALTVLGPANSRSKDVFDLFLLLPKVDNASLKRALAATFSYRDDPLPKSLADIIKKMDRTLIRKGWKSAAGYIKDAPDFDVALDTIIKLLKEISL